jgi:hypothetical protein
MLARLIHTGVLLAQAQAPEHPVACPRPAHDLLRAGEDYTSLRDSSCRTEFWDPIKFIDLHSPSGSYLSLGADFRQRYESLRNSDWGRDPEDDNGYLLQRYMLHADVHVTSHVRAFAQLSASLVNGRRGGPRATDEDRLDLHQAFSELAIGHLALRAGRQEVQYGSARLVSVSDGPNIRRSFDGARLMARVSRWQVDAFGLLPVDARSGVFDNSSSTARVFWGLYAAGPLLDEVLGLDLYYLGLARAQAAYDQGVARERRHSAGVRAWGKAVGFDYDVELIYQWGSFGSGSIRAWTAASAAGYTVGRARLGLKADITSGDDDPLDADLQTFHPLFPRGSYFGLASLIGPLNHFDLHPSLELRLPGRVLLVLDVDVFWRTSTRDGLYRSSGGLQTTGQLSDERYVGTQTEVDIGWNIDRHSALWGAYAHFFGGPFLAASGLQGSVDYFTVWFSYRI